MKNNYNKETDTIYYKGKEIKNFFKDFPQQQYIKDYVKNNLILLCVGGSHAYGLDTETSDIDIRGIFKDSLDQILGLGKIEQLSNDSQDITIYSFSKALHLISEQNPNMHELLWVDEDDILYATDDYWKVRERRWDLLSSLSKQKYSGYAISQLKRLRGHNKWLSKEQEGKFRNKPHIKDYINCVNHKGYISRGIRNDPKFYFTKIKNEVYNIWGATEKKYPVIEDGNNYVPVQDTYDVNDSHRGVLLFNKSQFQQDLDEYKKWKKWKENRNETRHSLEEKYGYDTKHAMHTFRLLSMGKEILEGKGVIVKRSDRDFLLDIRNGKYSYEYVMYEATKMDVEDLEKLYLTTALPRSVDKKIVIDLIKEMIL